MDDPDVSHLRILLHGQLPNGRGWPDGIRARRSARARVRAVHHGRRADRQRVALGGRRVGEAPRRARAFAGGLFYRLRVAGLPDHHLTPRSAVPARNSHAQISRTRAVAARHRGAPAAITHVTTLPDYFLADLPLDAVLTPTMLREACLTLKRNRAQFLATRKADEIVR